VRAPPPSSAPSCGGKAEFQLETSRALYETFERCRDLPFSRALSVRLSVYPTALTRLTGGPRFRWTSPRPSDMLSGPHRAACISKKKKPTRQPARLTDETPAFFFLSFFFLFIIIASLVLSSCLLVCPAARATTRACAVPSTRGRSSTSGLSEWQGVMLQ
jgi:hypothetical protein